MKKLKVLLAAVIILFIVWMGINPAAENSGKTFPPSEGDKMSNNEAPDFTLRDLNGRDFTMASLKGKVVIINFWATWCPACVAEMPSLNKLYRGMKSRGLEIVAVSTDKSANVVKSYISRNPYDFQIVMDEDRKVTKQYRVYSLPTTFLIDKKGVVVEKFYGEYDWTEPDMKQKIERLL